MIGGDFFEGVALWVVAKVIRCHDFGDEGYFSIFFEVDENGYSLFSVFVFENGVQERLYFLAMKFLSFVVEEVFEIFLFAES